MDLLRIETENILKILLPKAHEVKDLHLYFLAFVTEACQCCRHHAQVSRRYSIFLKFLMDPVCAVSRYGVVVDRNGGKIDILIAGDVFLALLLQRVENFNMWLEGKLYVRKEPKNVPIITSIERVGSNERELCVTVQLYDPFCFPISGLNPKQAANFPMAVKECLRMASYVLKLYLIPFGCRKIVYNFIVRFWQADTSCFYKIFDTCGDHFLELMCGCKNLICVSCYESRTSILSCVSCGSAVQAKEMIF